MAHRKSSSKDSGSPSRLAAHPGELPPASPGDVLREALSNNELTQDQLADAIGITRYSVNQVINGRRAITPVMALRLARATDTSPEFWLNLQRAVDLFAARRRYEADLSRIEPVLAGCG
ncbi:MAG: HigA family addiction module antitoxin [Gemmatimonadaceae bacterium]